MVFREQTVNVGQSGGTVQMKFGDVTLELGYRQAEALGNQLLLSARAGRRANPPSLKVGDSVRCIYGRCYGELGVVRSCNDGAFSVAFNKGAVGAGYAPHELELAMDE